MFVVMGATGNTGRSVLTQLQRHGVPVRALTRHRDAASGLRGGKVEVVAADPMDADSLSSAFAGADAAYVMVPPFLHAPDMLAAGRAACAAIANAAGKAGLRHIVALSSGGAHLPEGTGCIRTLYDLEAALRASGIPVTFLRVSDFMENWTFAVAPAVAHGIVPSGRVPLDGPMQTVSVVDIGRVAADCLLTPTDGQRIINLLGPEEYTPLDVGSAFSQALGKPVEVTAMPREALLPTFIESGIGPDYARGLAEVYAGLNSGLIRFEHGIGETRRGTVTLLETVRGMIAKAAS